jgi:hypothetical protein
MKDIGINTSVVLQNAPRNGIIMRDMVTITAKHRDDPDVTERLCIWNGKVPTSISVIDPKDGSTSNREFQPLGQLAIPLIPSTMELEVRTIRLTFSRLSLALLNAIRLYDAKMAPIEIHRGIFDPVTGRLTDPALCRFFGFINSAPITISPSGKTGGIELECVSYSRIMTRTSGKLFSDETLKERGGDRFGQYLDVAGDWRVWWGQDEKIVGERKGRPKEKFFRV